MKRKWLPFIGFIFLIACLTSVFYLTKIKTKLPEEIQIIRKEFQNLENQILRSKGNLSDLRLFQETETKRLSELICKDCLFFRYSELSCKTCVDETIQIIKESLGVLFIESKLVVLVESSSPRLTRIFKEINGLEDVQVWLTTEPVLEEIDAFYTPYFFTLDDSLNIKSLKMVIQQLPSETQSYLSKIRKGNIR